MLTCWFSDRTAVDLYLDGTLMAAGLLFGDVGDYQDLDAGEYTVTVTTANSIDDVIAEMTHTAVSGEFHTVIATGVGEFNGILNSQDDLRRVTSRANVAFTNVSPTAGVADLYVLLPGQSITDFLPTIQGISSPGNEDIRLAPETYELTLTQSGTRTGSVQTRQN